MSELITKEYNSRAFTFRADGYFNMTKAARAFGKEVKEYLRLPSTISYIAAFEKKVGKSHLLDIKPGRSGGTWGHPKLAIRFASWLDEDFAIWCDCIIEDILTKKAELVITKPETSATVQVSQSLPPGLMLAIQQLAQGTNSASMHLNSRTRTPIWVSLV